MKNYYKNLHKLLVGLLLVQVSFLLPSLSANAQNTILNNDRLRMGNGNQNSVNTSGNLEQPFYFNSVQNVWRKLTYSSYPLDNAYAIGGDKTNEWNLNGTIVQNPTLTGQVVNGAGFTITNATTGFGYGTIVSKGNIDINGSALEIENSFTLPQPSAYIQIKVKVKNVSDAPVENVRIWIGTRDDWVGNTDSPTKHKGNLTTSGEFAQISTPAERSAALKIFTNTEGILFYTKSDKGNTIANSCCSWSNIINQNPETSTTNVTNDGSYGFYVRFNDLAVGASDEFVWYYAAGELNDLDDIIRDVAAASGRLTNLSSSGSSFGAISEVPATGYFMVVPRGSTPPTAAQIVAGVNYGSVSIAASGNEVMTPNVEAIFDMSGLTPTTLYDFYFISQTEDEVFSEIYTEQFSTHSIPTIAHIADTVICQDAISRPINFLIGDADTVSDSLTVSATSANTALIPNANISFGGSGANRTISLRPTTGQFNASSLITITVRDSDGDSTTRSFEAQVLFNDTPIPAVVDTSAVYYIFAAASDLTHKVTGTNLLWYNAVMNGSPTISTPLTDSVGTFEYWVTQTVGVCESPREQVATITVSATEISGDTQPKRALLPLTNVVDNQITVQGSDNIPSAVVSIGEGFDEDDELLCITSSVISQNYNDETGELTLTGILPAAEWTTVLRNVRFRTWSSNMDTRTINFNVAGAVNHFRQIQNNGGLLLSDSTVDENLAAISPIGSFMISGADEDLTFIYQFTSGTGSDNNTLFSISDDSLHSASTFDYEIKQNYSVRVLVIDNYNKSYSSPLVIKVNNMNDIQPVIEASHSFTFDENGTTGTVVDSLHVSDGDGASNYTWTIVSGNTNNAFSINPVTGAITIANSLAIDFEITKIFTLVVSVSDGVNTSEPGEVIITINNLNDSKPVITILPLNIDENSITGTRVGIVAASDIDGLTTFSNWTITGGNNGNAFSIDPLTGEITVSNAASLDFENSSSFTLQVSVSDGVNSSESEVVISLNNLNDTAPVIALEQVFQVTENSSNGTSLGHVMITDADGTTTFSNWTIINGNTGNAFAIDPITGEIVVNDNLAFDFEGTKTFTIIIEVSDGTNIIQQEITFTINNENDNVPTDILISHSSFNESVSTGARISDLSTVDLDGEDIQTYTLVAGEGDTDNQKFTIAGNQLVTAKMFNYDFEKTVTVRIRTTDNGGAFYEKSFTITLEANIETELVIPTAFSPNGDQVNDTWDIDRLLLFPNALVKVFNNDGIEVFTTLGYTARWNGTYKGKELAFGTYYFIIKLNDASDKVFKGTVMIIK